MDKHSSPNGILTNEILMDVLMQDYVNVEIKRIKYGTGSTAGDHNLSEISRVTVDFITNGDKLSRSYIIKHIQKIPFLDFTKAIEKENSWYEKILPKFNDMNINIGPKCYKMLDHLILLEDLSESGYSVSDRLRLLDTKHCKAAVRSLAKFHAVTHYLYLNNGLPQVSTLDTIFVPDAKEFVYNNFRYIDRSIEALNEIGNFKYDDVMNDIEVNGWSKMMSGMVTGKQGDFLCIVHGDFWTTNMLFKYDENGDIVDTKIIDFQLIRVGVPTFDLYFFLSTSVKPEVLNSQEDLQTIYSCYIETLNQTLDEIECSSRFCERKFHEMMKETSYIGVFIALTFLPVPLCENPIVFEPPQHLSEDEKHTFNPFEKVFTQDTHRNHLQILLDFYRNYNVI